MTPHTTAPASASNTRLGVLALLSLLCFGLLTATLGASAASAACSNAVFRTGPSGKLPDCRAYELVTPTYTAGLPVTGLKPPLGLPPNEFQSTQVDPGATSVLFQTFAGSLPGLPGTGNVDRYRSVRTDTGWVTKNLGPTGSEAEEAFFGGAITFPGGAYSVEQDHSMFPALWGPWASLSQATFLRTPSGVEPLARGSLGDDPEGEAISATPGHVFFTSTKKLEANAPTLGSGEIVYDRSPEGPTHVVSLLPGDVTPTGSMALLSHSPDGREAAFRTGTILNQSGDGRLYVRVNNGEPSEETIEVLRPGGSVVGQKVTCAGGPTPGPTIEYQWLRNGAAIPAATAATYTIAGGDAGTVLQCRVAASNSQGITYYATPTLVVEPYLEKNLPQMTPTVTASLSPSNISQAVGVGETMTCNVGQFTGSPTIEYQWLRDGVPQPGATSSTYSPVAADASKTFQCRVTASTADGKAVVFSSGTLGVFAAIPRTTADPAISNVTNPGNAPAVGNELSCSNGTWTNSPGFTYQWLRSGAEIGGAAANTYTVVAADEGKPLQCRVAANNAYGTTMAVSGRVVVDPQPGTAPPSLTTQPNVSGVQRVGSNLSCPNGTWTGSPTFTRQWLRNGVPIGGAVATSYTSTAADLNTVVQCAVTATNASGSVVVIPASATIVSGQLTNATYILPVAPPNATATLPTSGSSFEQGVGYNYDGLYNGYVFYSNALGIWGKGNPADLFTVDVATGDTVQIANTGDARFINVSDDGSHVYFTSPSQYGGKGTVGQPNLYVWSRADESVKFIVTLSPKDVGGEGFNGMPNLTHWPEAFIKPTKFFRGRVKDHSRSTPDGQVFAFESTAQITPYNNVEVDKEDCADPQLGKERCTEVYLYDAASEQLQCISCPADAGPAHSEGRLQSWDDSLVKSEPATPITSVESLTDGGEELFFETGEPLVSRDRNETYDVYRWKKGEGIALISSGRNRFPSYMWGVSADGSDVIFTTQDALLPQDENGSASRFYDARVEGGYPPPESTVTEPCSNDVCQGQPSAAPEEQQISSASIEGAGNFSGKLKCGKGLQRVERHGKESCAPRKKRHRGHKRRKSHHGRAGNRAGAAQ